MMNNDYTNKIRANVELLKPKMLEYMEDKGIPKLEKSAFNSGFIRDMCALFCELKNQPFEKNDRVALYFEVSMYMQILLRELETGKPVEL